MIRVVYTILVITIKDLEIRVNNLNLQLGKSTIWFESLVHKKKTGKQMADTLSYKY